MYLPPFSQIFMILCQRKFRPKLSYASAWHIGISTGAGFWFALISMSAFAWVERTVELPTADKKSSLRVVVSTPPEKNTEKTPVVIFVGGVFFDADGLVGNDISSTPYRRYLFREISERLLQKGIATVRFDQRGTNGNLLSCPKHVEQRSLDGYVKHCVDARIRGSISPETQSNDIRTVYEYVRQQQNLDASKIGMFAHSEGAVHVSRLVKRKEILPFALAYLCAPAVALSDAAAWQFAGRVSAWLPTADTDLNGSVDNDELRTRIENKQDKIHRLMSGDIYVTLKSPSGSWDLKKMEAFRTHVEQRLLNSMLTSVKLLDPTKTFYAPMADSAGNRVNFPWAANSWLRAFFFDDETVVSMLDQYSGRVLFLFAELDEQLNIPDQMAALQKSKAGSRKCTLARLINAVGHNLSRPSELPFIDLGAADVVARYVQYVMTTQAARSAQSEWCQDQNK